MNEMRGLSAYQCPAVTVTWSVHMHPTTGPLSPLGMLEIWPSPGVGVLLVNERRAGSSSRIELCPDVSVEIY